MIDRFLTKVLRQFSGREVVFLRNCAGIIGMTYIKNELRHLPHSIYKNFNGS
jgi:hypothetical protein